MLFCKRICSRCMYLSCILLFCLRPMCKQVKNLRNVAIPGTGVPLSLMCILKVPLLFIHELTLMPHVSACYIATSLQCAQCTCMLMIQHCRICIWCATYTVRYVSMHTSTYLYAPWHCLLQPIALLFIFLINPIVCTLAALHTHRLVSMIPIR
jgi:hypothetical protein